MNKITDVYNKHLNLSKRIQIEQGLNNNKSFRSIGLEISKSHITVIREVKARCQKVKGNHFNGNAECKKTYEPPFVCNGCENKKNCKKDKYFYYAKDADADYRIKLVESRQGIDLTCEEFNELNETILKEVKEQGLSFDTFLMNHSEIDLTTKTLYNYQEKGYLTVNAVELPRKVRYKKRKRIVSKRFKKDSSIREGRTYTDFEIYMKENNLSYYVQTDTVEGEKGKNCLLTFRLISIGVLLAYKLENKDTFCVKKRIKILREQLGNEDFRKVFPAFLPDNGVEFSDVETFENNGENVLPSKLFYCDPGRSDQKGSLENVHEDIRRFVPKGNTFNIYTDVDIQTMVDNINSYKRKKLGGKSAYDLFKDKFGEEIFNKLGLHQIESKDVVLKDTIFKK